MKKIFLIIVLLYSVSSSAQNNYKIPVGSLNNKINLKVTNPADSQIEGVTVELVSTPEWIEFGNKNIQLGTLDINSSASAAFEFNVKMDSPINEEGIVSFNISTGNGQNWVRSFTIVAILPDKYELFQNYPNPFNPNTIIKFSVPIDIRTTLHVYNILGEMVKVLLNQDIKAGIHKIDFEASHLASGVYFYKLTAGDFVSIKKMMLIK